MAETTTTTQVKIDTETHRRLRKVADLDRRNLGQQIAWMVLESLQSRNIDPDTLEPVEANGSSGTKPKTRIAD